MVKPLQYFHNLLRLRLSKLSLALLVFAVFAHSVYAAEIRPDVRVVSADGNTSYTTINVDGVEITTGSLVVALGSATAVGFTINGDTLDTNEWAYLDGQDQAVDTTASPQFADLVITDGGDIKPSVNSTTAISIAQADGTDFVTFDTTNKWVGIGTATPGGSLEINGGGIKALRIIGGTDTRLIIGDTSGGSEYGELRWDTSGNYLGLDADGSRHLVLQEDGGNVGIGTSTPNGLLEVKNASGAVQVYLNGTDGNYKEHIYQTGDSPTTSTRWRTGVDNVAEGGSNAGSNFYWNCFNDAGGYLGSPLWISRATRHIGISMPTSPAARLHQDGGYNTTHYHKFTTGAITGQTASDGFDVGITGAGVAELRQRENLALTIYTNNTLAATVEADQDWLFPQDVTITGELNGSRSTHQMTHVAAINFNVASGDSSHYMDVGGVTQTATKGFRVAPNDGSIVAMDCNYDVTAYAGAVDALQIEFMVNGATILSLALTSNVANDKSVKDVIARDTFTFSADDILSARLFATSGATPYNITLDDIVVNIELQFDD